MPVLARVLDHIQSRYLTLAGVDFVVQQVIFSWFCIIVDLSKYYSANFFNSYYASVGGATRHTVLRSCVIYLSPLPIALYSSSRLARSISAIHNSNLKEISSNFCDT